MQPPPHAGKRPGPLDHDFARFGRHRLRAPSAAIIDLPVQVSAGAHLWVATIWPDSHSHGGWARQQWTLEPISGRGWQLPHQLAAGDVVEFGADTTDRPVRWYGIMDTYEVDRWATLQGPYTHPAYAWDEAQRLLALERFLEPLDSRPVSGPPTAQPRQRSRSEQQHSRRRHRRRRGTSAI